MKKLASEYPSLLTILVAVSVVGCSASEQGVTLKGLTDPDSSCVYAVQSAAQNAFRVEGVIDLNYLEAKTYQMRYMAGVQASNWLNNTVPQTTSSGQSVIPNLYLNANDVYPRKAHVKIRKPDEVGTDAPGFGTYSWVVEMSGNPISAATAPTSPGAGVVLFEMVPYNVILNVIANDPLAPISKGDPEIRTTVEFSVDFKTGAGNIVTSNTAYYTILLCNGCLTPANFNMADFVCGDGSSPGGFLCSPGQDMPLTCGTP